jgi:hypothetical protein
MEQIEDKFGELIDLYILAGEDEVIFYLKKQNLDDNEIETIIRLIKEMIEKD